MKNYEKFKTAEERVKACTEFLKLHKEYERVSYIEAAFSWLTLEADEENQEKQENCPFCGCKTLLDSGHIIVDRVHYWVECVNPECMYMSAHYTDEDSAIAAHNRVCRAVAKAGGAK